MSSGTASFITSIRQFFEFVRKDVWTTNIEELPKKQHFWIKQLRVFLLAIKGFRDDDCVLRASALTFFTLLSTVPLAAVAFGIAKGFGLEESLDEALRNNLSLHEDVVSQIIGFADNLLQNTRGGLLAGVGFAVLLFSAMRLLHFIELTFNKIWGINRARGFSRKFSDFLTILIIGPILVILSASLSVVINTHVEAATNEFYILSYLSDVIVFGLKFIPYIIMWGLLTLVYMIMPNTRVSFLSALVGGIVAGTLYQIIQWGYINFQVNVSSYGAIYGSFAAIPLFFAWIQLSWLIILFGAELSYAHQAVDQFEYEDFASKISANTKLLLSLVLLRRISKNFEKWNPPLTMGTLAHDLKIPIRICTKLIQDMSEANLISEVVADKDEEIAYQPARDIATMDVFYVIERLENLGESNLNFAQESDFKQIKQKMLELHEVLRKSSSNVLVKDL